jgi:uncharacterized phage protein (TIGR01671 family)
MREILFRGFHRCDEEDAKSIFGAKELTEVLCNGLRSKGIWLYGNLMFDGGLPYIVGNFAEVDDEVASPEWWGTVLPDTVGQFTGLIDKNGKKIFEADILKNEADPIMPLRIVKFLNGSFTYQNYPKKDQAFNEFSMYTLQYGKPALCQWLVIENIYDNPELLGESHEHH